MFHILPPCHLVCTSQLGRTWLMPVGSVTIATTQFFFSLPDNHLPLVSSNRVARLKVLYEVKMLIFCQHTGKITTDLYEWKKVLQRSGRHAAARPVMADHGSQMRPATQQERKVRASTILKFNSPHCLPEEFGRTSVSGGKQGALLHPRPERTKRVQGKEAWLLEKCIIFSVV